MAVTNVLRPVSVRKVGAGVAVPSGTLAAVTSDDSDATYIDFNVADNENNWSLRVEPHTPAVGYGRHQVRGRVRIRTDAGTCTEDIDLGRGTSSYFIYQSVPVNNAFTEQITDWSQLSSFGLATVGALSDLNIGGGWLENALGGATEARTAECYVDIDCRLWPIYTPEIRDNAGVNRNGGTITDTNQPTFYIGSADYDGLPPLNWFVNVRTGSAKGPTIWTASGQGVPPPEVDVDTGLDDGTYWAVWGVRSTIRGADVFEHVASYQFTIQNTVPPPSPPLVTVEPEFGGYRITWQDPGGQTWTDGYVVAEVWRDDCTGSSRIATVPDGLNGSYLDLAIPQIDPAPELGCDVPAAPCDITYRVRYQGYVSTTVELPDTIPAAMILGWPGTAASIPAGWSRVTSLDGVHVRGTSDTGAPVTTGGTVSHSHGTLSHSHAIGPHSHTLGGNTDSSNGNVTSVRSPNASTPQAQQPHYHARPSATGTHPGANSSSTAPGTSVANNAPPTREVIWVKSDGAQTGYAVGALGWATESVSAWTDDASSAGRFLKGAATGANGGVSSGAATHSHTVNGHTHNGFDHDHTIGATGISNPFSFFNAGSGGSNPRWLPKHTHPMDVINASTGNTTAAYGGTSGGTTSTVDHEPPNRRLRVLRNTGGGTQTRIIGLYVGTVAALDPIMTLCDGSKGTPDMRTYFARDKGPDSVNSTGGSTAHLHTAPDHAHDIAGHSHDTNVGVSTTTSYGRATTGDLDDNPSTGHTHGSGNTGSASPVVTNKASGKTNILNHLPPYKEVHFVRLDGTVDAGPLAVPELKVSEFASVTVPSFTYSDDLDRLSSLTDRMAVTTDRSHDYPRLVADSVPLDGGLQTVSTSIPGEDMSLTIAVEGLPAINRLETLLRNDRVYFSPVGGTPGWYAPMGWTVTAPAPNVKVLQVTMVRQPWPATLDPEDFL